MTTLKREDLLGTKWDAREWTQEMKTRWQQKMFELGFKWPYSGQEVQFTDRKHFYLGDNDYLSFANGHDYFLNQNHTERKYTDAFPERSSDKTPKTPSCSGVHAESDSVNDTRKKVSALDSLRNVCKEYELFMRFDPDGEVIVNEMGSDVEYKVNSEDELEKLLSALEVLNSYVK